MKKELLFSVTKKDLSIQYFSGTGAGGQHRNKHQNCVRMFHADSGARVTGQSNRERIANVRQAFNALTKDPKFIVWHTRKTHEALIGKSIDELVKESMHVDNIRVEEKDESGKWVDSTI